MLVDKLIGLLSYKHTRFLDLEELDPGHKTPIVQAYLMTYDFLYKRNALKSTLLGAVIVNIVFYPTLALLKLHILKYKE